MDSGKTLEERFLVIYVVVVESVVLLLCTCGAMYMLYVWCSVNVVQLVLCTYGSMYILYMYYCTCVVVYMWRCAHVVFCTCGLVYMLCW